MLNAKNRYYGDASDFAPGGPRRYTDDEDKQPFPPQPRKSNQAYAVPPAAPLYQNDPRGYVPAAPSQGQSYQQPTNAYQNQPVTPQQIADSIAQLARLRDNGIISEAEFQNKKNELMNRL
jgi:hypothetical protein